MLKKLKTILNSCSLRIKTETKIDDMLQDNLIQGLLELKQNDPDNPVLKDYKFFGD